MTVTTSQISAAEQAALQTAWQELAGDASVAWETLRAAYSEPSRHYHNLRHIHALLAWAAEYRAQLQDYTAVRFAIWYHDAVYVTKKNDNEERSAALAARELNRLNVATVTSAAVEAMILATKTHQAGELGDDARWFLDFDLAILGSAPETYRTYCAAIRREYQWVPGLLFRRKRRQVLESFLQRKRLFFTDEMQARLEAQARRNLQDELTQLN